MKAHKLTKGKYAGWVLISDVANTITLVPVDGLKNHNDATWTWNGHTEKPTFTPSINASHNAYTDDNGIELVSAWRSHVFITDGIIQYLGDCTHQYKNQSLPLNDIKEKDIEFWEQQERLTAT